MFLLLPYWLPISLPSLSQDVYLTHIWMTSGQPDLANSSIQRSSASHRLRQPSLFRIDKEIVTLKATELRFRLAQILINCQSVGIACECAESCNSCVWAEQLY